MVAAPLEGHALTTQSSHPAHKTHFPYLPGPAWYLYCKPCLRLTLLLRGFFAAWLILSWYWIKSATQWLREVGIQLLSILKTSKEVLLIPAPSSLGEEAPFPMKLQYSCLENFRDRGAWPWGGKELDMTEHMHACIRTTNSSPHISLARAQQLL